MAAEQEDKLDNTLSVAREFPVRGLEQSDPRGGASATVEDEKQKDIGKQDEIDELKAVIDRGLGSTKERQLMAASEVADLLLDIRLLLAADEVELETSPLN